MKRALMVGFAVLTAAMMVGCATSGPHDGSAVKAVQRMKITDHVRYHNMGIAWDGEYYYTVNGGNTNSSDINKYSRTGAFQDNYDLGVDGRAILYSPDNEQLYVKPFGTDLILADLDLEETDVEHEGMFQNDQSHVAMSPDGLNVYELNDGEVHVYDAYSGDEDNSFELSIYSSEGDKGYAGAIAASDKFLFVWAPSSDKDIMVYDHDGNYVNKFSLPRAGFGFSLSWANDMLWVATDADGGEDGADGTWYGYAPRGLE